MKPVLGNSVPVVKENGVLKENENDVLKEPEKVYKWDIAWQPAILLVVLHIGAVYGFYICMCRARFLSVLVCSIFTIIIGLGMTTGAHRMWSHRCYKARLPLRILLCVLQTFAMENPIYNWVRDHRVHHKFTETDADPHNSNRGFFFAHMGWLMLKKHKEVLEKGKTVDLSDLLADPVVVFQRKYYNLLMVVAWFGPIIFAHYVLREDWDLCFFGMGFMRYTLILHATWSVNSAAHLYGTRPYNRHIGPRDNTFVAALVAGEGWHNYHHTFPWDYKAAELGYKDNFSTKVIDFFASIGWAYDLRTVSPEMIKKRAVRTGDGTWDGLRDIRDFSVFTDEGIPKESSLWGYGDVDAVEDDYTCMTVSFQKEKIR